VPKSCKFTEEEELKICSKYLAGHSINVIRKEYRVRSCTISKVLKKYNIHIRDNSESHIGLQKGRNNARFINFTEPQRLNIIKTYELGESAEKIAKSYGCSIVPILRVLKEGCIKIKGSGGYIGKLRKGYKTFSDTDKEYILNLYVEDNWSLKKIGSLFNCGFTIIRRVIVEAGLPLKSNPETQKGLRKGSSNSRYINFSKDDLDSIVCSYLEGTSLKELAVEYSVSRNLIRRRLIDSGVTLRNVSQQQLYSKKCKGGTHYRYIKVPEDHVLFIVSRYLEGMPKLHIGNILGYSINIIVRVLKEECVFLDPVVGYGSSSLVKLNWLQGKRAPLFPNCSGIYCFLNTKTGKVYVGSSLNMQKRKVQHIFNLNRGKHTNSYLQNSWNTHNKSNFVFLILENVMLPSYYTKEEKSELLCRREQHYLNKLLSEDGNNIDKALSYNLDVSASHSIPSDDTRRKQILVRGGPSVKLENVICREYLIGKSSVLLSHKYGFTPRTVCNILRRNNVNVRCLTKKGYSTLSNMAKKDLCSKYKEGVSSEELAIIYDKSPSTICRMLKKEGIVIRGARLLSIKTEKNVCEKYTKGSSTKDLALEYYCSVHCIFDCLKRNNIAIRTLPELAKERVGEKSGRYTKLTEEQVNTIVENYKSGKSMLKSGECYNLSIDIVKRVLRENGVQTRNNSDAQKIKNTVPFNIKKFTREQIGDILQLKFDLGWGTPKIAKKYECSIVPIIRVIKENQHQLTDIDKKELVLLRKQDVSWRDLEKHFQCLQSTLKATLDNLKK